MVKEKIYFIYMPSPMLGRSPIQGINGAGFFGNLFGVYTEDKYISKLKTELERRNLHWSIERDNTESDIQKLIEQKAKLFVCAPGLKYQFYRGGFDKENIIYLSMIEYASNITHRVFKRIDELENERKK
ncbi:nitrogen fixation protein NifS [Candidatus Symbiopectobacterium sp. NZEC127]|uniref:nitrogen fixation protein NifS n=1 Tax=Candidatus Symbiopectobacterium sp. NZEC127 TaxID=2820472 RepID=UPI0022275B07|nr:nitrogen fixation protein NifS [Candidatus Symbiopectobacterium sp. NZEC127]